MSAISEFQKLPKSLNASEKDLQFSIFKLMGGSLDSFQRCPKGPLGFRGDVVPSQKDILWNLYLLGGLGGGGSPGAGTVTNAMLANMPAFTFKGRNVGTSGPPIDLTLVQAGLVLGQIVNVKWFGAKGDARKVTDGAVDVGVPLTVNSATAAFTAADIGKKIFGSFPGFVGGANNYLPFGTITAVAGNGLSCTTDTANTATVGGLSLIIGTDDTAALQAAGAYALLNRKSLHVPSGGYIFTAMPFDFTNGNGQEGRPSIIGDGSGTTIFYPSPNFDFSSTTSNGPILWGNDGLHAGIFGIGVDCYSNVFAASGHSVIHDTGNGTIWNDVFVTHAKGFTKSIGISGSEFNGNRVRVEFADLWGITVNATGFTLTNHRTANCNHYGLYISTITGETNTGLGGVITGGLCDECQQSSCFIENSTDVNFTNTRFYGGVGSNGTDARQGLEISTNSKVKTDGCAIVPWTGGGNVNGVVIGAGCILRSSNTRFGSSGSGTFDIVNAGKFIDLGGNAFATRDGVGVYEYPSAFRSRIEGASFTLAATDANANIRLSDPTTPIVVTVPTNAAVPFPIDTEISFFSLGAAANSIAPDGGVTINSSGGLTTISNMKGAVLKKVDTDEWDLVGGLE